MQAQMLGFGKIEISGQSYDYDLVIEAGEIRKRKKGPSRAYKAQFGHTPLSAEETIPWEGDKLIIGMGVYGSLPVMDGVYEEAERRGVEVIAVKTDEACALLADLPDEDIYAVLHITC